MKQDMLVILDLGSTENTAVARAVRAWAFTASLSPRYHQEERGPCRG